MRLTWVGHATVLFDTGRERVITDPALTRRLAHIERRVPMPSDDDVASIDTVLLSHVHMDHFHKPSLSRLGGAQVVVPAGARRLVPSGAAVTEVRAGDRPEVCEVTIDVVPADHSSRRGPHSRIEAQPVGYVVRSESSSIYFAGDTGLFPAMTISARSTSRCCRSGVGGRRSVSVTSIPRQRPRRPRSSALAR